MADRKPSTDDQHPLDVRADQTVAEGGFPRSADERERTRAITAATNAEELAAVMRRFGATEEEIEGAVAYTYGRGG